MGVTLRRGHPQPTGCLPMAAGRKNRKPEEPVPNPSTETEIENRENSRLSQSDFSAACLGRKTVCCSCRRLRAVHRSPAVECAFTPSPASATFPRSSCGSHRMVCGDSAFKNQWPENSPAVSEAIRREPSGGSRGGLVDAGARSQGTQARWGTARATSSARRLLRVSWCGTASGAAFSGARPAAQVEDRVDQL